MKAARLHQTRRIVVEEVPLPRPGPGEVLIGVRSVGICGTDLSVYRGDLPVPHPLVLGHEFAGIVAGVGPGVEGLKEGERVVAEASWGCGHCYYCAKGQSLHCLRKSSLGRTVDGAFAEFIKVPAQIVYRVSRQVPFDEGQATPTIASAIRGLDRTDMPPGAAVVILGPGHAGLLLLQLCKLRGAGTVIVAGTRELRLGLASKLGADAVVNTRTQNLREIVMGLTSGMGVDLAIEAAGVPATMRQAMSLTAPGGKVLFFGIFETPVDGFEAPSMYSKELTLVGSKGGFGAYPTTVQLLEERKLQIKPLLTHFVPLEGLAEALEMMDRKAPDTLRVVVKPGGI